MNLNNKKHGNCKECGDYAKLKKGYCRSCMTEIAFLKHIGAKEYLKYNSF